MIFGKRLGRQPAAEERESVLTRAHSSQLHGEGVEREYEEVVISQLTRLGVPLDTVEVEVRHAGAMPDGRNIYVGMVRLTKWQPRTSLRLLVALPLLETKTRQSLETTWLSDVSHFGGLWVHASSALRTNDVLSEIHDAVKLLELGAQSAPGAGAGDTGWSASVQAALEGEIPRRSGRG